MVRNSLNLKYYILAPGMVESGGSELAHQMCAQLTEEYERMEELILDIFKHYEEHISRFEEYRKSIISEKKKFEMDVNRFVDKVQML